MNLKTLLVGLVSGFLLTACGGPVTEEGPDAAAEQLGTTTSALCEGWDSGARKCSFKCYSSDGSWWTFPAGYVAYGQCQEAANQQCARTAAATCWSK